MKKGYAVMGQSWKEENFHVLAVYKTRAKANKFIKKTKEEAGAPYQIWVVEWEVK